MIIRTIKESSGELGAFLMSMFKDFLHNLFYILTPIFIYVSFWKGVGFHRNRKLTSLFIFLLCLSSMILSMTFPVYIGESTTFDLRHVPLIIGTIYGGWRVGLSLLIAQITYRIAFIGTEGLFFSVYLAFLCFILFYIFSKYHITMSLKRKMIYFMLTLILITSLTFVLPSNRFADNRLEIISYMSESFGVYAVVFSLVIYLIERIRINERLKSDLRKSEQLRLVSELAASVAHEVRNPMTVARGFIQLIHSNANISNNERKYLQLTLSELDRAQSIISDYLSLAKSKKSELQTINITYTLDKVRHTIQAYALMNNVSVYLDVPSQLKINGDEKELTQVILNIAKNAIEAMPEGGSLFLSASHTGQNVRVKIADTGTGMTKEEVNQLGTAYYSTKEKGTGLGLMVSFNIIRSWGGHIQVNSQINKGTEFLITLPTVVEIKDEHETALSSYNS